MQNEAAVYVRNACKAYGKKEILKDLCMTVPRGSIYGLLGASGCGKTTLLSCVVGRKYLNAGEVYVLGGKPGTVESGVPGPKVGYMPQNIALVGEFTVKDAVYYFGRLFQLDEEVIETRFRELSTLLDLPPDDRYIKNCSGGQQRRVSFAASMVHKPQLLILDEPTAGVDPLLRDRIWQHLIEITKKENMAVVITTHYIEEARQADAIGLMREGKLLAEESPSTLLTIFNTDSLEEVFLILSRKQEEGTLDTLQSVADKQISNGGPNGRNYSNMSIETVGTEYEGSTNNILKQSTKKSNKERKVGGLGFKTHRVKALLDKNWKQFYRNVSGVAFLSIFPILEALAFLMAIGGDIKGIKIAVVGNELQNLCANFSKDQMASPYSFSSCNFSNLECGFLEHLKDPMLDLTILNDLDVGLDGIKHGKYVGVLYMTDNFTESIEQRINLGKDVEDGVVENAQIKTYMDMSNRQIGGTIKVKLLDLYKEFQKDIFNRCKFEPKFANLPLNIGDPVYGDKDESYTVFMTPGVLLTLIFFLGTVMTSQIIITDRFEGVWDRSAVAGVTALEITLTHFLLQVCIVAFQVIEIFVITFYIFNIKSEGNTFIIALIVFLQGICGMCYGFWISIISYNHSMANIVTTASFYPMIIICGLVWPLEGQPMVLQWVSKCLPFTIASLSVRNVLKKGWGIDHLEVLNGLGIEIVWIVFLTGLSIFLIKGKQ